MKKYIGSLLLYVLLAGFMYTLFIFIWGSLVPQAFSPNLHYRRGASGHLASRLKEAKEVKDVDLLILGSSHAYRGFDSRIFEDYGLKTFNLGSSAQSPVQTKVLLNRYLDSLNPKTVIYEVYPITFIVDGVESSLDIISNDDNDYESFQMALELNNLKTYNTLLYAVTRELLGIHDFSEDRIKEDDMYVSGGYVEKQMAYYKKKPFPQQEWNLDEEQLEVFGSILEELRKRDMEVILVFAPITQNRYRAYGNNAEFDRKMEAFGEYYNFNGMKQLNDTLHFYDTHHLNQAGVEIFNDSLIEVLEPHFQAGLSPLAETLR